MYIFTCTIIFSPQTPKSHILPFSTLKKLYPAGSDYKSLLDIFLQKCVNLLGV